MSDEKTERLGALEALNRAVQDFSNAISSDPSQAGVVTQAIVVWEEMSINEEGNTKRGVYYAVPTDNFSMSGAVGLLRIATIKVEDDIR